MKPALISPPSTAVRDYTVLADRIRSLRSRGWGVREDASVCDFPLFTVERAAADNKNLPLVLLVGGIHGNEPAGVEAALAWMESSRVERWPVQWLVLPCANPCGWVYDHRAASKKRDLNRNFSLTTCCKEVKFIRHMLSGRKFLFAMDFHEDSDAPGYYICEIKTQPPFSGEKMIAAVESILPIWDAPKLDGRKAVARGCVRRSPATPSVLNRRQLWPLEFYLITHHTTHTFCSETPMSFPMEQRVRAHHAALETALAQALS